MNELDENRRLEEWESKRREYRQRQERILRILCPELEIDEEISNLDLVPERMYSGMFPGTRILAIIGDGFERPLLPGGTYMYCSFRPDEIDARFVELTPRNSALSDLLTVHWEMLCDLPPVQLADFILTMQTVGTVYHEVLSGVTDLDTESRRDKGFVLSDAALGLIDGPSYSTSLTKAGEDLTIHALTLYGWMHEKQELGITTIKIARDGGLQMGDRETICERVFQEIPSIWY